MTINWDNGKSLETIKTLANELGVKDWKLKEAIDMYFEDEDWAEESEHLKYFLAER